ncbi:fatty acid-binding protein, muscle isoform X2 [Adelges cooleyi]|uniref:fatty acid-binding protein, muscle isoform X2 n=1 Tax=Adelges cooleyi TaxID=133065 RepID=UPI00217FE46A|nr:fatty acid-binding protein, muscle isoform X2 [Adelges cooleyi]
MEAYLNKKYKLSSSDKFDEYMKALGVGMITRKVGNSISPIVELNKGDDDKYTLKSTSTFKNTSTVFKMGEQFDEETLDGRKVKSIITQEGNKLVHKQIGDKVETTIVREFKPDELKMILTVNDIICTRIYKPVE